MIYWFPGTATLIVRRLFAHTKVTISDRQSSNTPSVFNSTFQRMFSFSFPFTSLSCVCLYWTPVTSYPHFRHSSQWVFGVGLSHLLLYSFGPRLSQSLSMCIRLSKHFLHILQKSVAFVWYIFSFTELIYNAGFWAALIRLSILYLRSKIFIHLLGSS